MIRKYAEIFCWKNVSSFCSAKATHIFSAKNIRILYIVSAKTVNEMTLHQLVKLTKLWTTGPRWTMNYSEQLVYLYSLIRVLTVHFYNGCCRMGIYWANKTEQTAQISRLTWACVVCIGHTGHFFGIGPIWLQCTSVCIHPNYSNTLIPYHTFPKI